MKDQHGRGADDPRLTAYALGQLSEDEAKQFEREIADDADMQRAVEEIRELGAMLGEGFARQPEQELSGVQRAKIAQAASPNGGTIRKLVRVAAAAGIAVGVGYGAAYWFDSRTIDEPERVAKTTPQTDEVTLRDILPFERGEATDRGSQRANADASPHKDSEVSIVRRFTDREEDEQPSLYRGNENPYDFSMSDMFASRNIVDELAQGVAPVTEGSTPTSVDSRAGLAPGTSGAPMQPTAGGPSTPGPTVGFITAPTGPTSGGPAGGDGGTPGQPQLWDAVRAQYGLTEEQWARVRAKQYAGAFLADGGDGDFRGLTENAFTNSMTYYVAPKPISKVFLDGYLGQDQFAMGAGRFTPADSREAYARIHENDFLRAETAPLSTFSTDVDTASYANMRRFLKNGSFPPPDAIRIEELINYFSYSYEGPRGDVPFSIDLEVAACPWKPEHRLARVALRGRDVEALEKKVRNLVFLIDVSGSMNSPLKLPLLKQSMKMLVEHLGESDRIAIVTYAGASGCALEPTFCEKKAEIMQAIEKLTPGGSTNGAAGIELAYQLAAKHFDPTGINRVILATDGDFNVGVSSNGDLTRMIEEKRETGVFLSVLGFGTGNLQDSKMESLADHGNGNYAYIDSISEARKVLVHEMGATLETIAKDVKIQVEFNPARVTAYRLIGYENRVMAAQDFNDDKKDAGEIGAGHRVTALYEIVPVGGTVKTPGVDPLKYQTAPEVPAGASDELMTVKLRYKQPNGTQSQKIERALTDAGKTFEAATTDFRFASAVASFGMLLRQSKYRGNASCATVSEIAGGALGGDEFGYRGEFLELVDLAAKRLGQ